MGVHNLWTLLEPCGRRIDIRALRGKRLAIDASGWIFRFIKAMRDDRGEMLPNAHLIGFFRRICKLLFHNIRPIFIFDGATPALKRKTVLERRRRREQQEARVRRTAEKLLLNRLKQHALAQVAAAAEQKTELAQDGVPPSDTRTNDYGAAKDDAMPMPNPTPGAGAGATPTDILNCGADLTPSRAITTTANGLGDTINQSQSESFAAHKNNEDATMGEEEQQDDDDDDDGIDFDVLLPEGMDTVDPVVLSTLPPSMQLEVMLRVRDRHVIANRSGFEQRTGKPQDFSQYQMQQYLKGSTLRRRLDTLRGVAGGAGGEGAPRPIAAEEGREYVLTIVDGENTKPDASDDKIDGGGGGGGVDGDAGKRRHGAEPADDCPSGVKGDDKNASEKGKPQRAGSVSQLSPTFLGIGQERSGLPGFLKTASDKEQSKQERQTPEPHAEGPPVVGSGATQSTIQVTFDIAAEDILSDESMEWEDVDGVEDGQAQQMGVEGNASDAPQLHGEHWRARAAKRQKFWSLSHGFQKGRKLASWGGGDDEQDEKDREKVFDTEHEQHDGVGRKRGTRRNKDGGARGDNDGEEEQDEGDVQLQEAIRRSLVEQQQQQQHIEVQHEGVMEEEAAGGGEVDELKNRDIAGHLVVHTQIHEQRQNDSTIIDYLEDDAEEQDVEDGIEWEDADQGDGILQYTKDDKGGAEAATLRCIDGAAGVVLEQRESDVVVGVSDTTTLSATALRTTSTATPHVSAAVLPTPIQTSPQPTPAGPSINTITVTAAATETEPARASPSQPGAASIVLPPSSSLPRGGHPQNFDDAPLPGTAGVVQTEVMATTTNGPEPVSHQPVVTFPAPSTTFKGALPLIIHPPSTLTSTTHGADTTQTTGSYDAHAGTAANAGKSSFKRRPGKGPALVDARQDGFFNPSIAVVKAKPVTLPPLPPPVPVTLPVAAPAAVHISGVEEQQPPPLLLRHQLGQQHRGTTVAVPRKVNKKVRFADEMINEVPMHHAPLSDDRSMKEQPMQRHVDGVAAFHSPPPPPASTPLLNQVHIDGGDTQGSQTHAQPQTGASIVAPLPPPPLLAASNNASADAAMTDTRTASPSPFGQNQRPLDSLSLPRGDDSLNFDESFLKEEEMLLRSERRAAVGQADAPTDAMFADVQELLQLFGIPYLIAPSEAEAQCAWLNAQGLVDGVVTDDSDALLFGARRVYRNIFEERKYVEEYRAEELETELGLARQRLVGLALLLGSDYTPGVGGVGVVNALEVVQAFGDVQGLKRFAQWVDGVDDGLVALAKKSSSTSPSGRGGITPKKSTKQRCGGGDGDNNDNGDDDEDENEVEHGEDGAPTARNAEQEFKSSHRNLKKGWTLPADFPSQEVMDAYLHPKIDAAKEKFAFARPDAQLLRRFCAERLNWETARADELLVPVLKAYDERLSQQTLDSFISYRQRFAKIKSKRLQKAVKGIMGEGLQEDVLFEQPQPEESGIEEELDDGEGGGEHSNAMQIVQGGKKRARGGSTATKAKASRGKQGGRKGASGDGTTARNTRSPGQKKRAKKKKDSTSNQIDHEHDVRVVGEVVFLGQNGDRLEDVSQCVSSAPRQQRRSRAGKEKVASKTTPNGATTNSTY